jgi:alpha-beta hydrolase superfamily lysophospholipase
VHQAGRRLVGWPGPAAIWGGAFGALFWATNYVLVAPALGIMPPPDRDRRWRAPVMLAANLIWGAISAVVGDRLTVRGDSVTSA